MYSSDIRDKEWLILAPFIAQGKMGRPRTHDIRQIINAIRYVMKSGCQWRLLPKEFPPWQTVYDYYLRWRKNGKWQEIHDALVNQVREKVGKINHSLSVISLEYIISYIEFYALLLEYVC